MTIRVRLFAHMAAALEAPEVTISLPEGARLDAVRPRLQELFRSLPWPNGTMLAVNQEYALPHHVLHENDEVAIIPPVSGGADLIEDRQ